jgi:hypothetical protein
VAAFNEVSKAFVSGVVDAVARAEEANSRKETQICTVAIPFATGAARRLRQRCGAGKIAVGREPGCLAVASGQQALEYRQVTDSADLRRSFQDRVCDKFGGAGRVNVRGNIVDWL